MPIEIEAKDAGLILTFILTTLGLGKLYGKKNAQLNKNTGDIKKLTDKQEKDVNRIEAHHEADMVKIARKFIDDSGEPLIMTHKACQEVREAEEKREVEKNKRLEEKYSQIDFIYKYVVSQQDRGTDPKTREGDQ